MQNCCYCFNLKTGTIASALFILITRTFLLISFLTILTFYHSNPLSYWHPEGGDRDLPRFLIFTLIIKPGIINSFPPAAVECALFVIFSPLLCFGVKKANRQLFWPWMVLMALEITAEVIGAALCIMTIDIHLALAPVILLVHVLVFNCYLLHCVVTYYKVLAGWEHPPAQEPPSRPQISATRPLMHSSA